MIWISIHDLIYPDGWIEHRDAVRKELHACTDDTRRSELLEEQRTASVWRGKLAYALATLSNYKCWYCESQIARDDLSIDHFRPKGRVFEEPSHPGYWWLAVDEKNFRVACRYCNERRVDRIVGTEGGKRTHFPLVDEAMRAFSEDDDLDVEQPELLDPLDVLDPLLLRFTLDGRVAPALEQDEDSQGWIRATRSIEILHLRHHRLKIARGQVASQVLEAIQRTDTTYRRLCKLRKTGSSESLASAEMSYREALRYLANYTRKGSPYAGVARSLVRQHRTDQRPYLDTILQMAP